MAAEKVCKKCAKPKPIDRFRVRKKKRGGKIETYTMGKCQDCENIEQNERYHKDPQKSRDRQNELNRKRPVETHKKRNKERWEKRKGDPKWAEYRSKDWRENEDRRKKHQELQKKQRDNLDDSYVVARLKAKTKLKAADIRSNPELIELKKLELEIQREIKKL